MTEDVPERVLVRPEPDEQEELLPEIAEKLGMTVSMLRSQPDDVLQMIRMIYLQTQHDDAAFADRMQKVLRMQDVSPIKDWEMLHEVNMNCIDGIVNNLPPEEIPEEAFTFSRRRLRELAAAARMSAAHSSRTAEQKQHTQSNEEYDVLVRKEGGSTNAGT